MSTHKEYWCKKDEKAINYHYNDAMGEILPFVVAGFMVIGLIVYRIRLGRKDQRLPSPFQKANLKQGLVFGQQVPFTLLKESSIFPKSHPDMELVYGELFERLYAHTLGESRSFGSGTFPALRQNVLSADRSQLGKMPEI
jgi:hypothetical protein